MPTVAGQLATGLETEIAALQRVAAAGGAPSPEVEARLFESVLLNAVTELEALLEDLFFAIVASKVRLSGVRAVVRFPDEETARGILLRPGERYTTWLPIKDSVERISRFLVDGKPFSRLTSRQLVSTRLTDLLTVRNAIAHKSGHAQQKFREISGGRHATVGDYLRSTSGQSSVCSAFLADIARYGNALCSSEAAAEQLLGTEDPLPTGKKVRADDYRCHSCGTIETRADREPLRCLKCDPACPTCGKPSNTARFEHVTS